MYRLYYSPGACSLAPHVALCELGLPHEAVRISTKEGQNRSPEFLKINPRGEVPVLETPQGQVVREGAAILLNILGSQENKLMPIQSGPRATALEWLMSANASLHPLYGRMFFFGKQLGEGAKDNALVQATATSIQKMWDEVEARLEGRSYLCGEECTIGDILHAVIAGWNEKIAIPPALGPNTQRWIQAVTERPAFQEALKVEAQEAAAPEAAANVTDGKATDNASKAEEATAEAEKPAAQSAA